MTRVAYHIMLTDYGHSVPKSMKICVTSLRTRLCLVQKNSSNFSLNRYALASQTSNTACKLYRLQATKAFVRPDVMRALAEDFSQIEQVHRIHAAILETINTTVNAEL